MVFFNEDNTNPDHLQNMASRLIQHSFRVWWRSRTLLGPSTATKLKRATPSRSSLRRRSSSGGSIPLANDLDRKGVLAMMEGRSRFLEVIDGVKVLQVLWRRKRESFFGGDRNNPVPFSPPVYLHGKYICGNEMDIDEDDGVSSPTRSVVDAINEINLEEVDTLCIEIEETEKPSMIPRRVKRVSVPIAAPIKSPLPKLSLRRKDEFDESGLPLIPAHLNRLTIDNTKKNSLYKTCELDLVIVPKEAHKPESPERSWSKKTLPEIQRLPSDGEDDVWSGVIKWEKRVVLLDELSPKEPLDPEVIIPIKPILKRPAAPQSSLTELSEELPKSTVKVTKFVYPDDEEYAKVASVIGSALEMIESNSLQLKGKRGKKKPQPMVTQIEPQQQPNDRNERRLKAKPNRVPVKKHK